MRFLKEDINSKLNPLIWDGFNLRPEVKIKLELIRDKFIKGLEEKNIPVVIIDTRIVGSNASYNYTEFSDLDLHIIVDYSNYNERDKQLLEMIYNYYKSSFNDKYNIKIKDIDIELYIENKDTSAVSNGIYSLNQDKWLQLPKRIESKKVDISKTLNYMINKFENVKITNNSNQAQDLLDYLYANRIRGLAIDGEFSIDNLVFKEFRNRGFIQELKDIIVNGESKELSLESLTELLSEF